MCATRNVTIRGNSAEAISAAPCDGLNLTLVSVWDYLTGGDDDFGFVILKGTSAGERDYQINGLGAGEHSVTHAVVYSLALPQYVTVESRRFHVLTPSQSSIPDVTIPSGRRGLAIVELLGYQPASDHDFEYVVNPQRVRGIRPTRRFSAYTADGRLNSGLLSTFC